MVPCDLEAQRPRWGHNSAALLLLTNTPMTVRLPGPLAASSAGTEASVQAPECIVAGVEEMGGRAGVKYRQPWLLGQMTNQAMGTVCNEETLTAVQRGLKHHLPCKDHSFIHQVLMEDLQIRLCAVVSE